MKVTGYDLKGVKVGSDKSNAPFTIEVIKLTSPNGEAPLSGGIDTDIKWTTHATKADVEWVKLYYTINGGTTWKGIFTYDHGSNPETHTWTVPAVNKTKCKVKVVLQDGKGNSIGADMSDDFFAITTPSP